MNTDCSDIRVVSDDETTQIPYWIESGCNTTSTAIWAKIPSIPASSNAVRAYVYYGTLSPLALSSSGDVFPIFDDFSNSTLNPSKWNSTGTIAVSSGEVTVRGGVSRIGSDSTRYGSDERGVQIPLNHLIWEFAFCIIPERVRLGFGRSRKWVGMV